MLKVAQRHRWEKSILTQRKTVINKKTLKSVDPKRIITALKRVKQQLYDRPYDPQAFIDKLYNAYAEILKKEAREIGHPVSMQHFVPGTCVISPESGIFSGHGQGKVPRV